MAEQAPAYQVLARKYRPRRFADLIGQDAMVRTLTHAFASGRIAHAFMLTGVRGVGKTTTARLLARALNYRSETIDAPSMTLDPPGEHCDAIARGAHVDVMEMDAASRTGVGDIREILDGVRYSPVQARYKVYVIDEVHMLSTAAFNALLKTLEEPPAHAKFIFATTEIRKVPVTVLSRCQRFDLKRIDPETLVAHLRGVCEAEAARVADDALTLIARASEGSVRDALSLLDQAIVLGEEADVGAVRDMLGLADRTRTFELFAACLRGEVAGACAELADQHAKGADPIMVLRDLLDHCHDVTRVKALGEAAVFADAADQIARFRALAGSTSLAGLSRVWQMLLKAHDEARASPDPLAAVEMALIRIAYAAGLPPPEAVAALVTAGGSSGPSATKPAGGAPGGGGGSSARLPAPPPPRAVRLPQHSETGAAAAAQRRASPLPDAVPRTEEAPPPPEPDSDYEPIDDIGRAGDAFDDETLVSSLADLAALAEARRDLMFKSNVERFLRPIKIERGRMTVAAVDGAPPDLAAQTQRRLQEWTGARWLISLERAGGGPTLAEQRRERHAALIETVRSEATVAKVLALWPDAEIIAIRSTDGKTGETE